MFDYIFCVYAIAYLCLCVAALALAHKDRRLSWNLYAGFAFAGGIWALTRTFFITTVQPQLFSAFLDGLVVVIGCFFFEFNRRAFNIATGKRFLPAALSYGVCLVCFSAAGLLGGRQLFTYWVRLLCILGGGCIGAAAFFLIRRNAKQSRTGYAFLSILCAGFGITTGLVVPEKKGLLSSWFGEDLFLAQWGIPIQMVRAAIVLCMALVIWEMYYSFLPRLAGRDVRRFIFQRFLFVPLFLGCLYGGSFLLSRFDAEARRSILKESEDDLLAYRLVFQSALERLLMGLRSMAGSPWICPALIDPDPQTLAQAHSVLDRYQDSLQVSVAYLMDADGLTVASSNRDAADSFLGKNYGFRPYFRDALVGRTAQYYAVGITSGKPGFYGGYPVRDSDGQIRGVVAMKMDLDVFIEKLHAEKFFFLCDPEGVIFITNVPDLGTRSLWPLAPSAVSRLLADKQYPETTVRAASRGGLFPAPVAFPCAMRLHGRDYLVSDLSFNDQGWRLIILNSATEIILKRRLALLIMLGAAMFVVALAFMLRMQHEMLLLSMAGQQEAVQQLSFVQGIIDALPVPLFFKAQSGRYLGCNRLFAQLYGRSIESVIGKTPYEITSAEEADEHARHDRDLLSAKTQSSSYECRIFGSGGRKRLVLVDKAVFRNRDGSVGGIVGMLRDLTEREEAQTRVADSERRFRTMIEKGMDIITLISPTGEILFESPSLERILGYAPQELIGKNIAAYLHPLDLPRVLALFAAGLKDPSLVETTEIRFRHKDGSWRYLESSGRSCVGDPSIKGFVVNSRDVTERRLMQQQLQQSAQEWQRTFDSISDYIFLQDKEMNIVRANEAFLKAFKITPEELKGRKCYEFLHHRSQSWPSCPCRQTLSDVKPHTEEVDDPAIGVPLLVTTSPILDDSGVIIGVVHTAKDISERKRAEAQVQEAYDKLKDTQAQLVQSAKMASMGVLAGGVAHEINNPLTGVLNNVQLIKMMVEQQKELRIDDFREILQAIEEAALRCVKITKTLLESSRASAGALQPVSLNTIVEKTLSLIQQEFSLDNIILRKRLQSDLPLVEGDAQLLQQVIMDLISNARWAVKKRFPKGGGEIGVETVALQADAVRVVVQDNGIGIPEQNRQRLFEPFFTTKEVGEGTGLGLSIVYNIIKRHQGKIEVESAVGEGARFIVTLPLQDAP